jgi:hypothetical protein
LSSLAAVEVATGVLFGIIGIGVGVTAAIVSVKNYLLNKKIHEDNQRIATMLEAGEGAFTVIPAWYSGRMLSDVWWFGLELTSGKVLAISQISAISSDGKWMDVSLLTEKELPKNLAQDFIVAVADDRRKASVQISEIITAYDLVTS